MNDCYHVPQALYLRFSKYQMMEVYVRSVIGGEGGKGIEKG